MPFRGHAIIKAAFLTCYANLSNANLIEADIQRMLELDGHANVFLELKSQNPRSFRESDEFGKDGIASVVQTLMFETEQAHSSILQEIQRLKDLSEDLSVTSFWMTGDLYIERASRFVIQELEKHADVKHIRLERKLLHLKNRKEENDKDVQKIGSENINSTRNLISIVELEWMQSQQRMHGNLLRGGSESFLSYMYHLKSQVPSDRLPNDSHHNAFPTETIEPWNLQRIQAEQLWKLGINGSSVRVGVIDSGAMATHPRIKDSFLQEYGWLDAIDSRPEPYDDFGHGTAVISIIAGTHGIGLAPGVKWMACRACDMDGCLQSSLIKCAEFMTCPPDKDGSKENCAERAPHIIQNSWNDEKGQTYFQQSLQTWIKAGIIPVFSTGNGGSSCSSVDSPAEYIDAITVGATTKQDALAHYSGRGPGTNGIQNPDLCAPGEDILTANGAQPDRSEVMLFQGTSAAAPHVSGAIALLLQVFPNLTMSHVRKLLQMSADTLELKQPEFMCDKNAFVFPNNEFGYGRLNVWKAYQLLLSMIGKEGNAHL